MPPNVVVEQGDFSAATSAVYAALDALGGRVLQALAVYLGQTRDYFADKVNEGNSILRVIHYPPIAREGEDAASASARAGHVRVRRTRISTSSRCCWAPTRGVCSCFDGTGGGWR